MQDKKLLQIGEVAKIFHVSMGTLRHYEQEGLLEPEYVDEKTGYRYYGVRQLEVLNTIRYLRVLDLPLSEIAEFLLENVQYLNGNILILSFSKLIGSTFVEKFGE